MKWQRLQDRLYTLCAWTLSAVLVAGIFITILPAQEAAAAQLTTRSVTISTSKASATATYTYTFTIPTAGNVQSIQFQACTTPLSTCTSPGGTINMNAGTQAAALSGWTSNTGFTRNASGANNCTAAANVLCISRTQVASESGSRTIGWNSQVNPTAVASYYIRITTYSDTAWLTAVDSGVVAYAIVNQLTVNARIQEILSFCVGTTSVNDSTTTPGADCSAISGTTVDIGVLDTAAVNISPVSTNGGTNTNGVVMVRTNAQAGVVISYFAEQETSSGALKVAGATCGTNTFGGSITDQCINNPSATPGSQAVITAGAEAFGMTIAAVNCVSTTSYTCAFTSGTYNLARDTEYDGNGGNTYGTSGGFAWLGSGSADTIASSASSSVKVVDDEALILRFAATPSITTPTGAYTVTSTYIATATY